MAFRLIKTAQIFQRSYAIQNRKIFMQNGTLKTVVRFQWTGSKDSQREVHKGWKGWRAIVKGFLPIGICMVTVMIWRVARRRQNEAANWEIQLYCLLPLRAFSRTWGWIAERQLPESLRSPILGLYTKIYNVNLNEAASSNFKDYRSLADFFARPLRPDSRPVDEKSCLVSPCDGKVLHFGPVDSCTVEQVKGVTYSLEQFLCGREERSVPAGDEYRRALLKNPKNTLFQCILYLAPGDYHRFHSPTEWQPNRRLHVAGELLSVNPRIAAWIPGLFALNERAIYVGRWLHGFFSFTAVGATNVGSVRVYFDKTLHTNCKKRKGACTDSAIMPTQLSLCKGDPVGEFRMGSTVVLIFEAPNDFKFQLKTGQRVVCGQSIGCVPNVVPAQQEKLRSNIVISEAA